MRNNHLVMLLAAILVGGLSITFYRGWMTYVGSSYGDTGQIVVVDILRIHQAQRERLSGILGGQEPSVAEYDAAFQATGNIADAAAAVAPGATVLVKQAVLSSPQLADITDLVLAHMSLPQAASAPIAPEVLIAEALPGEKTAAAELVRRMIQSAEDKNKEEDEAAKLQASEVLMRSVLP